MIDLAERNDDLRLALRIVGSPTFGWRELYDVIELLGPRTIVAARLADESRLKWVKQTANHYRHLGKPEANPLPPDPPDFFAAHMFVMRILRRWAALKGNFPIAG